MGAVFAMGSGLLGGFRRALHGIDSDDLGKRWSCVAFRAESTCKTAQKLRAGSAGFALIAFWLVRFIDSRTSAFSFVIQRACEQGMGGAFGCWARIRRRHRLRCHQGRACPRSQRTQVNRGCGRVRDGGGCSGGLLTFRAGLNRRRRGVKARGRLLLSLSLNIPSFPVREWRH